MARRLFGPLGAVVAVVLVIISIFALFQTTSTEPGAIAVVRNGGPLDNKDIRQIVPPASGITWTGWFSTVHEYPTTERFTNVVAGAYGADPTAGDTADVDAYRTFTRDGVDVGVTGQFKFVLNTDDDPNRPGDAQASPLRAFDTNYGQRTYAVPGDPEGKRLAPWEGDEGFGTFLNSQVRPVWQEVLRQVLGDRTCAELVSSCALLSAGTGTTLDPAAAAAAVAATPSNGETFQQISDRVSELMTERVNASLGGPFLTEIRFSLTAVELPPAVRDGINATQVQFARVAEANGRASQAAADATANENRQRGYNACPTCAQLDQIVAQGDALAKLPPGVTVYAPGSDPVTTIPIR